jgi:amidohydrolase
MPNFLKRAEELKESMLTDRHYLHQHAEVGNDLPVTTQYVMDRLREIGLEPKEICKSGVVALIRGKKPGKTYLLRADMDALPMGEINDLPFCSLTDNAHNCGHDIHTSMLLAAAQMLKENEDELEGCVKLMFQPSEELFQGSPSMIEAGVLENPSVDACSAMHVMLDWDAPGYGCRPGFMTSSCDGFKITIHGKGCHGAMPELGIDPINVGLHIYQAFQELVARESGSKESVSLTFGQFSAGDTANIIPATAVLQGTLRTYNQDLRKKLVARMHEITEAAGKMFGAEVTYEVLSAVPSCYTDPEMLAELTTYLEDLGDFCRDTNYMVTPSDDFAFISEKVPTTYLMLGARVAGNPYPHHNPRVLFDENAMPLGAAFHAQCAFEWLKHHHEA